MRRLLQRKLCRRKTLLFTLFLLSLIIGTTPASAAEVTDVLTNAGLINSTQFNPYVTFSGKRFSSNAVYAGKIGGNYSSIQLNANNINNIVTTASGGTLKKIKVFWNSNTTKNSLQVYAQNSAYDASTTVSGTALGTLAYTAATTDSDGKKYTEYNFPEGSTYTYVAIAGLGGATYSDSIEITWDDGTTSEPQDFDSAHDQFADLTWNDTSSAYDLTMTYGDTFTLTPKSSTPPTITYAYADGAATDVVSIEGNKLTALKAGTTTIVGSWPADDNWNADTRTINVTVNHAPVCGDIKFSPAAGEVARGTEVTLSCENATEITYTVTPTGGTTSEPTTVTANTAKVTINEACSISATAKNKEGVETTPFTAEYTITAAPLCSDITFSPADGSVVDAGSTVTISCENAAKITYTVITDGVAAEPEVVTGASAPVTINAACTITAKAENADGVATEEFSASYTLPVMKDYTLFTDYETDDSVPDGDYIFVGANASGSTFYMGDQNGNFRNAESITVTDDVISVKEIYEIRVQKEDGSNYSLITKDGKYLYATAVKNINETEDSNAGKGKWTVTVASSKVKFTWDSTYGSLQMNKSAGSERFTTYTSSQSTISLYAPKSDALGNIMFSPASGSTVDEGTEITISAQNATSLAYSIKTGDVWSESVIITGNSVNVPVTEDCTISVIAKKDETLEQKSAEATYTVVHPVTYELVEEYNGDDIPDGDYIFASSKDDGSSFAIMGNKIDKYRDAIPVTPTGNKFDAYSRYTIKVQKEGNGNYSLITSEGKYLYSNANQDLYEGDNTYAGKWIPDVTGSTVLFTYDDADVDAVIKYNISTTPTRFKAYKASSTNGMRPISLYTVETTKCGTVIFNPAPDSELPVNSKVTIRCKNATQISYSITKDGVYQPTVVVPGNTAEVTITEDCTIQAQGTNAEGDSEIAYANYTVQKPYTRYTDFYAETGDPYIPTGDYIFVGNVSSGGLAGSYYMGQGMQGSTGNYREAIKVDPLVDGRIPVDKKYAITITQEQNGKYSLMTAEGKYLYPEATTSGEGESATTTYSIKESDTVDGNNLWDPHFDANGRIYFWWNGSEANGEFKFNPQQPRFKNYAASATSTMVSFDLYCAEVPLCRNLTFDPASESTVVRGSAVTISCINAAKIMYEVTLDGGKSNGQITVAGNTASVIVDEPCTIAAYAVNAEEDSTGDVYEATYTVIDPYVQFTEYEAYGTIPNGKYIFVGQNGSTGALSYMAEQATATDNSSVYRKAVSVTPFEDGRIGVSESFAIDIKKEDNDKYSLMTADGKYLYASTTTTGEDESATTIYSILDGEAADGQGQWTANVAENKVEFVWSNSDMGTLRFNSSNSRFKTYDGTTGTKFYLYAPTPKPSQVVCKDATITNDEINISVNKTITFHSEGAGKMACEILEDDEEGNPVETFDIVDGDTYVFTTSPKVTYQIVTIIPYDQYGTAHTPSELAVWINTFDLPKISYNFVDGEDKATFYAENGEITEIRPYCIDGTLEAAGTYPDNVIPFSLAQPRFKVTAKNEIGDAVEESFSFIQELCDRKGLEGGAYSVVINYKDANSAEVASFPIAETALGSLNWTMDGYLVNESDDILETYPFLIKESYITLHIAPYNSDGPTILNVIAAPAEGGEGAPARAAAEGDLIATVGDYKFVQVGGSPFYFNGEGTNFIKGNIEVSPFEYANIRITSIDDVTTAVSDILDEDAEEVFYNLQGVRVVNPDKGIYIRVKGNKTEKILK
ncbi:MAG: hypothetical protein ACI304_04385 [Lepagella sp.]